MNPQFGDARLEELKLLSEIDRERAMILSSVPGEARGDMIAFLVAEGFVTDPTVEWETDEEDRFYYNVEHELNHTRLRLLSRVLSFRPTLLKLTHKGRARLSELKQALRSGREREPFGILWDVRHWEQDLQIAIVDAREGSPLALAYLDMNGLKQVNDTHGHNSGDLALKAYFQAVASALGDRGQAYRLGGDEVLVVLPNHDAQAAVQLLSLACRKLMSERLEQVNSPHSLSIAVGVITTSDPNSSPVELRSTVDKVQYRAKTQSKKATPRPSVIAIENNDDMIIID